jgi:hypothetical protein
LQAADEHIRPLPEAEQQTTLVAVIAELQTWLEAIAARKVYRLRQ